MLRWLGLIRAPDYVIGAPEAPYMRRWWIIPRNRYFNIYLHNILRSDDDRALHDHPWRSLSFMLKGELLEHYRRKGETVVRALAAPGIVYRSPHFAHRLEVPYGSLGVWTLFVTGPVIREWGFHCPKGWRHWREFSDPLDQGQIGKGCD